ncbi:RNA-guided endonuclease InsQ/TnpB family protein [Apilactobacillus xinyiensis]|uniref:RNA-guided endonuclease InsQ/TnpB family protein n=1 Tax=Apilactobacillus xinyiensis TaxID=2841032 RepID=UPI001C7DA993|nr:RNA-guided endonuclease TnpB family protein [Apilactobacillus xinyiensis]
MIKTQKIKIQPNSHMTKVINDLFNYRRYIWNQSLNLWNEMYDSSLILNDKKLRPSGAKVRNELVFNKADWQFQRSARVLQQTVSQLDKAWKNYFNPKMSNHMKPKFKSKKNYKPTFTTDRARLVKGKLVLDKPKEIDKSEWYPIKLIEPVRFTGTLKICTITELPDGVYASLSFETEDNKNLPKLDRVVGVDVNVKHFNYNDGKSINIYPKKLERYYKRITYYQRLLAKKRLANPNNFKTIRYNKVKTKLRLNYLKVSRLQNDILQKFTTKIIAEYSEIHIEDLDVRAMTMSKKMGKNLQRSLFGKLREILTYKCAWYNRNLVVVDRLYPSTQLCSNCGFRKTNETYGGKQTLSGDSIHHNHQKYYCYNCGVILDRDENAVNNLIKYNDKTMSLLGK